MGFQSPAQLQWYQISWASDTSEKWNSPIRLDVSKGRSISFIYMEIPENGTVALRRFWDPKYRIVSLSSDLELQEHPELVPDSPHFTFSLCLGDQYPWPENNMEKSPR